LLDLLRATSPVAPDALPDLILLSDADLAIAAREGLIQPLDDLLPASSEADLYTFARDAARIDRKRMGLPVAADINHLVYRPETFDFPPGDWDALISDTLEYPFAFVDGAHVSDAVLSDYALLGGAVINAEGQPALTLEALTQLLALYRDARVAGTLSTEYLNWPDEGAAWAAFTASDATLTVVRASRYLAERATGGDLQHARVPAIDGARSLPIGRSWNLAIVTRDPRRQSIAARLIEHWSRVENLAAWTQAEHVLPASAEALSRWDAADGYVTFVRGELSRAVAPPSPAALDAIGPAFLTAIRDVLTGRVAPQAAATAAVDTVARGIR
jgi:ABC-type glycerol-3-phosphate transport system substrate-binding protein